MCQLLTYDTEFYAGGFMGIIRTNIQRCNPKYLFFYLLASSKYRNDIKLLTQGANINNINNKYIGSSTFVILCIFSTWIGMFVVAHW